MSYSTVLAHPRGAHPTILGEPRNSSRALSSSRPARIRSKRLASSLAIFLRPPACVCAVSLLAFVATLLFVAHYGSPVARVDDVGLVARINQHNGLNASWFWSQHVVHRIPLPRIVYVGLLQLTGDLRMVMYLNVLLLGGMVAALIAAAHRIRGRISYLDVFFPLILLHWGNADNLLLPFSLTFILPTALSCGILVAIISARRPPGVLQVLAIGLASACLPLCGGPGVTQAPAIALWLGATGILYLRSGDRGRALVGLLMLQCGCVTASIVAVYFIGFETGTPPFELVPILESAVRFTTLSLGPAAKDHLTYAGPLVIGTLAATAGLLLLQFRARRDERIQVAGILLYFAALCSMAFAIGLKGRGPDAGLATRYVTLPTPFLCAAYLVWVRYGPRPAATILCSTLCIVICALLPSYTTEGIRLGTRRSRSLANYAFDARSGLPLNEIVERHWRRTHSSPAGFGGHLAALRRAKCIPFDSPRNVRGSSTPATESRAQGQVRAAGRQAAKVEKPKRSGGRGRTQ